MQVDLAYFNYEHGGLIGATSRGDEFRGYDYTGLVRVLGEDDRWPHLFVMGEGDFYDYFGGMGMWGAVEAMRAAGGRAYVPLPCSLPREWGPFAPVIFYDAQSLLVDRFFDHRAPGFGARNRNLLRIKPVSGGDMLHVATLHGDMYDEIYRSADAKELRWLADERHLSAVLADFNETLSGPQFEPRDLEDPRFYNEPWQYLHRLRHTDGRADRPYRRTTGALDYLCGYWDQSQARRVGGIGFVDVAEQTQIYTGTNLPKEGGRQPVQLDHILLNTPLAKRVLPGTVRIHEPLDPENPDSDHKRISVTVEL